MGRLANKTAGMKRSTLASMSDAHVADGDVVRRRACDWCAAEVVTAERIVGMLTPPREDRIAELEKAKVTSKSRGLRNPWD